MWDFETPEVHEQILSKDFRAGDLSNGAQALCVPDSHDGILAPLEIVRYRQISASIVRSIKRPEALMA